MKIAMIGHKRIPGREGGIEVVVEELSTRMAKLGHDVVVYNRKSARIKPIKKYKGVKIITVPTIETKKTDALVYSVFASIRAAFHRYDVIHFHALGPSFFLIFPHILGIRTVVTVHGLNYKTPKWKGIGAKFLRLAEKVVAKYADEVIVLSKNEQKYFENKYNRKTHYIPNGAIPYELEPADLITTRFGLQKDGYILFVSRLVPGKGIEDLIEAYKKTDIKIPLVIAGDAPYVTDFADMIHDIADDDDRIKFIGFAKGKMLKELYSNTKLFVFPSRAEGMPIVLLEALTFGTHCLVSDIPENTEVGKHYVKTFKTADVEDLRKMLIYCVENKECVFPDGCRDYALATYDWDKIVEETLDCYRR